jgi:tetratricopeptide (TPR) repeat protein
MCPEQSVSYVSERSKVIVLFRKHPGSNCEKLGLYTLILFLRRNFKKMKIKVWVLPMSVAITSALLISVSSASADTMETFLKQAEANQQLNRMGDADRDYQNALREAERFGQQSPKLIDCLDKVATYYKNTGRTQQAEVLYQRSLRLKQQLFGKDSDEVAQCLRSMAQNYLVEGRSHDAEPLIREALQIYQYRDERDRSHTPSVENRIAKADCMDELAKIITQQDQSGKQPEEAKLLMQNAQAIRDNPLGR